MIELHRDSFSGDFYPYRGDHHLTVPVDWVPDWVQGEQSNQGYLVQPEYKPRTVRGNQHLQIHTTSATHDGCIWRQFIVPPGALSVRARCMGDSKDAGHGMQIGVDVNGGTEFTGPIVIWSAWYGQYNAVWENGKWIDLGVETSTPGTIITVFLRTKCDWRADAAAHFDDVVIWGEGGAPPPGGGVTEARVRELIEEYHGWPT